MIKSREVLHVCNVYYRLHTCMHFDLALFTCHHTLSTHAHAHMHTHTHTQAAPIQGLHFKSRLLLDAEWVGPAAVADRGRWRVVWASPYEQEPCCGSPLLPHTATTHENQPSVSHICHKWNTRMLHSLHVLF